MCKELSGHVRVPAHRVIPSDAWTQWAPSRALWGNLLWPRWAGAAVDSNKSAFVVGSAMQINLCFLQKTPLFRVINEAD